MQNQSTNEWAHAEFGHARLGDLRRTRRLVAMASAVAGNPAGKVTSVFDDDAAREGAFRLLENDDVPAEEIAKSAHIATARRSGDQAFVYVPVDGSSLNLTDHTGDKGFGVVGTRTQGAKGLIVMSAIAVTQAGTPIGLCGQHFWSRVKRSSRKSDKTDRRSLEEKETRHWLGVIEQAQQVFAEHAPETKPWFQLDRGGDAWPVLLDAVRSERRVTIRAAYNRRVAAPQGPQRYLREVVENQPVSATYKLPVAQGSRRTERLAKMTMRYGRVPLDLVDPHTKEHHEIELWAVFTQETETCPPEEKPLEWLLLTTYPVMNSNDAKAVVHGYTQRWRIEEFHKVWKTGACRVEEMQLRAEDHAIRWATILASVGMRLLRLTYLARIKPDTPATEELTDAEVRALIVLRAPNSNGGAAPTIADAVHWLAKLGGYTGKSSGGPPGALVIARGLQRVELLAYALGQGRVAPV